VTITLRPATEADYDFMRLLYHSTRTEEMTRFPFTEEEKVKFLDSQFAAQSQHYAEHYPTCDRHIIMRDYSEVGRLYVDRWRDQIRIVDIALVPEARGAGIGGALVREVLDEGERTGKAVTIHVEAFNPAMRLYQRLGFQSIGTNGVYYLMEWRPVPTST
jgi:ribosomal protein S18 acetylase RimI-like enzyme